MIRYKSLYESMVLDDAYTNDEITMKAQLSFDSPNEKFLNFYIQTDSMMLPKKVCTVGPFVSIDEKREFVDKYASRILSRAEYELIPDPSSIRGAINAISATKYQSRLLVD